VSGRLEALRGALHATRPGRLVRGALARGPARRVPGAHHAMTPRPGNDVPWLARNARAVTLV
jgi:hypothetical protein